MQDLPVTLGADYCRLVAPPDPEFASTKTTTGKADQMNSRQRRNLASPNRSIHQDPASRPGQIPGAWRAAGALAQGRIAMDHFRAAAPLPSFKKVSPELGLASG